jgi:long-chain acyl-CoA synthetase
VIVSGYNRPAWPMAYLGVLRAGAVAVPVDPQLEGAQLANIVRSSGAHVALWGEEVLKKGGGHTCRVHPDLRVVDLATIVDEDRRAPSGDDPSASDALAIPGVVVREGDVASIIYTSGTTGEPKGVMLSHANFTSLLASLAPLFPLTHKDRVLSVLPLHHTFEFTCGLLLPLSRGARILYLGEISPERLNDGLTKGRITAMVGVPALWQLLERRILARVKEQGPAAAMAFDWAIELNRLVGRKLGMNLGRLFFGTVHDGLGGHVRHLISGGAALPKDTAELFAGLGLPLSEGYGLTEASPVLTVAKASVKARPGHVGTAIPGVEVKIQSPDDRGVGEIVARGPNVMLGYANNPEATAQAIDDDGWLHTGDLGKMEKGRLVIVGRRKETIVSASGENVYPDDVETSLGSIDGVREYAIVGIDDPRGGERVACLAVPEPDDHDPASAAGPMSGFDLEPPPSVKRRERHERAMTSLRAAFQRLPRSAQPAVVHLYDADLPRTATRKVTRSEVKVILGRLVAASAPPSSAKGAFEGSRVRHAIATIANRKEGELRAETSLRGELGFDSLLTMELSVALEPLAGALDTEELGRCETVADVERLAGDRAARSTVGAEGKIVEKKDEPIVLPAPVAEAGKRLLGAAQMGFYDKVMSPKVYGRAFIPHNRNTLVASNHASHLDMGFVKYALGTYGEGLVSLAAQDYFFEKSRAHRTYFTNFTNLAAFDRKGGLRQALRQAGDLLESGKTLLIFPEGTRSTDGQIHDFKPTIGHLALANEVDILPVYLGGTYESWPKGSRVPTKREIVARIGPPLTVADLRRLTRGMSFTAACRKAAELTREAVLALRDGKVLDLSRVGDAEEIAPSEPRLAALFRELQAKYVAGRVAKPITYYFSLGASDEAKWTLTVEPERCEARVGKPPGSQADCVLKTSEEIFMKIVREAYTPSPLEFMSGAVKSNDISLLQTFQKAFDLA